MLDSTSKALFHALAKSDVLKKIASRYGMRHPASFARRFVAGETVGDAIDAARAVQSRGMAITLDLLGERVSSLEDADAATRRCIAAIEAIAESGIERNLSLKLTQLGLDVDKASAIDNLRRILERAEPAGFFVRIDMENSPYTDATLEIVEMLWGHGHRSIGLVLQSALLRSERDLARVCALGARVRLVKGAYKEPKAIAYQHKADVDAAFSRMLKVLLLSGLHPAIATHDPAMIALAQGVAREHDLPPDGFEFQMLYGIRRDLQAALVKDGYRVRVYIPFGTDWFPYFMRRLGERPANVAFVVRGIWADSGTG
jgi:proline dehydrogenase